ncbi:MAG: RICIN domain-containing protein [Pseudolysinimonas sp.]
MIRKHWRAAVIAAIATFSVLAGTIGSYAYWSTTASATLGVGAATLSTTSTGWAATVIGNADEVSAGSQTLTTTGSVTITNTTSTTSATTPTLTAAFTRASGSTVLSGATTLTVWSVASAASCTTAATPTSPTTATWTAGVTVTAPLAAGASVVYCLRNTIADRQDVNTGTGSLTFTPQLSAQLAVSNFTGGSTTTSTITTEYIFPLSTISGGNWWYVKRVTTQWCWDVSGQSSSPGALLISYNCKNNTDTNQDFRFLDANGDGYFDIQPGHATGLRIASPATTTSGALITLETANITSSTQLWQAQLVSGSTYQFVNRYSGLCLSAPAASTGQVSEVTCSGSDDQKFTLTLRSVVQLTTFTCANTGATTDRTVIYSWTADYAGGPYTIQARQTAASPWVTLVSSVGTTGNTSATVPAPIGTPLTTWTQGTYTVQILNVDGNQVDTGQIRVYRQGGTYYYARCT